MELGLKMRFIGFAVLPAVLPLAVLFAQETKPRPAAPQPVEINIIHPLVCLMSKDLTAIIIIANRSESPQSYQGEAVNAAGELFLTGAWDLILEEVKEGVVVSSKSLRSAKPGAGALHELKLTDHFQWWCTIPMSKLVDHPGNYRFRLIQGPCEKTGRLFRMAESLAAPDWVKLSYTPDKTGYSLGAPINVHFLMTNKGKDNFEYAEGGDYRGATRPLRFAFTAQTAAGVKAVDPNPRQVCRGGVGRMNPCIEPGQSYERDLPLLAYLTFPQPGKYVVKCYQDLDEEVGKFQATDDGWHQSRTYGGSFEIQITEPTPEQIAETIQSALKLRDSWARRRQLATLCDPRYLAPLKARLQSEEAPENCQALVAGIGSIRNKDSTRSLIAFARDRREAVRVAALDDLSRRMPQAVLARNAKAVGQFREQYAKQLKEEQESLKPVWDESYRADFAPILSKALQSGAPDEVSAAALCLQMLGDTDSIEPLAVAADRISGTLESPVSTARAMTSLYNAAQSLSMLGARPCKANASSSDARLIVWAGAVKRRKDFQTGDWETLLLKLMNSKDSFARLAAIEFLPPAFTQYDKMPWKQLFLDERTRFYSTQEARGHPPGNLPAVLRECIAETTNEYVRKDFREMLESLEKP